MVFTSHSTWFDVLVDGLNRLPRPVITFWIVFGLMGFYELPSLESLSPLMGNIIWTVITFFFGSRVLFKDIPSAYALIRKISKG
jgi:hypothetical protein